MLYYQGNATIQRAIINIKEKADVKGKKGERVWASKMHGDRRQGRHAVSVH
jgi:hypothetical protein